MELLRSLPYPFALGRGQDEFSTCYELLGGAAFADELFQGCSFSG
jgi:hypothetical protein